MRQQRSWSTGPVQLHNKVKGVASYRSATKNFEKASSRHACRAPARYRTHQTPAPIGGWPYGGSIANGAVVVAPVAPVVVARPVVAPHVCPFGFVLPNHATDSWQNPWHGR